MSQSATHWAVSHIQRGISRRWRRKWRGFVFRNVKHLFGMLVLGLLLAFLWSALPVDFVIESLSVQSQTGLEGMMLDGVVVSGKVLAFWLLGWIGIARIFSDVRDDRRLIQLWWSKKRTFVLCIFLTILSAAMLVLAGVFGHVAGTLQVLSVGWWQSLARLAVILFLCVVMVDGLYQDVYH